MSGDSKDADEGWFDPPEVELARSIMADGLMDNHARMLQDMRELAAIVGRTSFTTVRAELARLEDKWIHGILRLQPSSVEYFRVKYQEVYEQAAVHALPEE